MNITYLATTSLYDPFSSSRGPMLLLCMVR